MTSLRIIRCAEDCDVVFPAAARAAREAIAANGKPIALSMRRYSPSRSNSQNSYLWVLHGLMAAHMNARALDLIAAGLLPKFWGHFTAEAVHECIFKPKYCGVKPDGTSRSSTRLSKADFSEALQRYEADLVNEGIEIPENPLGDAEGWQ